MLFSLVACTTECSGNKPTYSLQISSTELQTLIGDTNVLKVENDDVLPEDITWTTENEKIATVDENGLVESISIGSTKIKAKCGNYEAVCNVTVSIGNKLPQLVIENERESYRIGRNEGSFPFDVYVLYNGKKFYDAEIVCKTTDENVASFDETEQGKLNVHNVGNISASFTAKWRGLSDSEIPSLFKLIDVTVIEELYFYINGSQYDVLNLSTVSEFEGQTYVNQMDFVLSADISGEVVTSVEYELPEDLLVEDGDKIRAIAPGKGQIALSCTDALGNEYQGFVKVEIIRPEATYRKHIQYFSSYLGTFKDVENNYENTTLSKELFGSDDVEINAYFDGQKLETKDKDGKSLNGKIFGMPEDYKGSYEAVIRVETNEVIYNVNATVYSIVVQSAKDLELFALKFIRNDNPLTPGIDETQVTRIDGYCVLIDNIDATGVKINHEIFDTTYKYVNSKNEEVQESITMARYNNTVKKNSAGEYSSVDGLDAFGFLGHFNGNGYTISNLNTSVEQGKTGGGLFGYAFGNAIIENVGFTNMNISNSSGLCYASYIPVPRPTTQDIKGLRTDNTYFHDIYIELSEDTVNPKGALMNVPFSETMGLINVENFILNATAVKLNGNTSGGVLLNNPLTLCAENITTRFYSNNTYVITDEYPAYFNSNNTVYGANETTGEVLDDVVYEENDKGELVRKVKLDGDVFSSKFNRYDNVTQMISAQNDYSSFSSPSWIMTDYPIFKTSAGAFAYYANEVVLDNVIKVNSSTNGKKITLTTFSGEEATIDGFVYDNQKLTVDNDGVVKLATEVNEVLEYSLTIRYTFREKQNEMTLKVLAYPSVLEIDEEISFSAYDGVLNLSNYVELPKTIVAVTQKFEENELNLTVGESGIISGARIFIRGDKSDVEKSTLIVETLDMTYKFTNVKVYSHILKKAQDFKALEHSSSTGKISGYYILANNINMATYDFKHSSTLFNSKTYKLDKDHVFQGVFDGQGYAIYNFRPGIGGLLGSIYSDTEENGGRTIIRNVAFMNVLSTKGTDFTIFGQFIESSSSGIRAEVNNVHVEIANTYTSADNHPVNNYKGLFYANSSATWDTFKFTNVYVQVINEDYNNTLYYAHGSILSRDSVGTWAGLENRSKRFDNVVTITAMVPCAYRQYVDNALTTTFDTTHMYVFYSESDLGKQGMRFNWLPQNEQYAHSPIADYTNDSAKGSYVYKNVYRYDTADDVDETKIQKFVDTGLWEIRGETLSWKNAITKVEITNPENNFDIDWLFGNN